MDYINKFDMYLASLLSTYRCFKGIGKVKDESIPEIKGNCFVKVSG